jgi:phosphoribosylformylglycinamidine synthase subunit PurQ / glutaminase
MRLGILVFPGSNCDHDCYHVLKHTFGQTVEFVWHKERNLEAFDAIIIPGGFSYGDYLRTGAIARFSPIMKAVEQYASKGGHVIGICNGFQILLEAGLLPGAMRRNRGLQFICKNVFIRVENTDTPFTHLCQPGQILSIPIAHADGNYFAVPETLRQLESNNRIIFRYCDPDGRLSEESNPNGSMLSIAGICNQTGNVMGMMPHPERGAETLLGSSDGRIIFESLLSSCGVTNE